jgi:hypothetical protein
MNKNGLFLLLALTLYGCRFGENQSKAVTRDASADAQRAIAVSPDLGSSADATIAGFDTDHNGIRDEVDRYRTQAYGGDSVKYSAGQLSAKTKQALLVTPMTDISAVRAAVYAEIDFGICLVEKFPTDPVTAIRINEDIVKKIFDTRQCRAQVQRLLLAVGPFTRSTRTGAFK